MPIPFLDLKAQYSSIKPEIDAAIQKVIDSTTFASGPSVEEFERNFAEYCGAQFCVGVGSGTSAITLLLLGHKVRPGDEVITVANTFFGTVEGILHAEGTPVLVDCDEKTMQMDPNKIEDVITNQTRAILPVHLFGQCADMEPIREIAEKHNLLVLEDAAQAHGATYQGHRAGALGDGASFSFYAGKNLGAYGEAGAIVTDDPEVARLARMYREHGMPEKYLHEYVGWNERMDGIQGAVLNAKLPHLDGWNAKRREHMELYRSLLQDHVPFVEEVPGGVGVYHLLVIRVKNRDKVREKLNAKGIATGIHYPLPVHLQPAISSYGWVKGDFPVTEMLAEEILSLPMFPELTNEQIQEVCQALIAAL